MKIEIKRINPNAQILVEIGLIEHGYQLNIQCGTIDFGRSICRDFGGNYKIKDMERIIVDELPKWIQSLEKEHFSKIK